MGFPDERDRVLIRRAEQVENLATDTPLDGAEIVIQPAPARLFCAACNKLVERPAGAFNCPACGQPARPAPFASGLALVGVTVI